jgi:hypothetical protein
MNTCVVAAAAPTTPPIRVVNLGGWLVVEGWIKPSPFRDIPDDVLLVCAVCMRIYYILAGNPAQLRRQGSSNQVCSLEQYNTSNILEFVIKGS